MDHSFDPADHHAAEALAQRNMPRDAMFLQVDLRRGDGTGALTLRVRNLSAGGMMVDTPESFARGEAVTLTLRNIGDIPARVAWTASGRVGFAFDRQIDPHEARKAPPKSPGSALNLIKVDPNSRRPGLRIG